MNRFIVVEPSRGIGCRTCESACVVAHAGAARVRELSAAEFPPRLPGLKCPNLIAPVLCRNCEDAPCLNACPSWAIVYRQNSVQVE